MQFNKINNKEQCRLAVSLSFKGSSGQRCMVWGHAHVILQSHGFTGKRSCMFSCAALPSWLAPPPLPSLFSSTASQCERCLDTWQGVSRLSCRDRQPHKCRCRGWLAGFPWKPLDISGNQPQFCDLVGDCGNLSLNNSQMACLCFPAF